MAAKKATAKKAVDLEHPETGDTIKDVPANIVSNMPTTDTPGQFTDPGIIEPTPQTPKPDVSRETATAVIVCDPHGHPHRTFSLEVHGETFRELAEKYVSSRPGWSLKA